MDYEIALISRAISVGGIDQVIAAGIEPQHFTDPDVRAVYQTCVDHFRLWRVPPSSDAVKRRHPEFKIMPVLDDLGYVIQEFTADCAFKSGVTKWRDIGTMLDSAEMGDHEARTQVVDRFMEHAREMANLVPTPRSSRLSDMANRIASIKQQQQEGVLPGVRIGIPQLDPIIHVVRRTEMVTHCGYSGRGKTQGLARSTAQAYAEGEDCLFFSLEMEEDEIWEIFDAHVASLSRKAIRRRSLSPEDYDRYMRQAERVSEAKNDIIVIDDTDGAPTVDKLAALIERFRPTVVGVDYVSLMAAHTKASADWERVTLISRSLKQLARGSKIKLYVAAQNNRDAAENGPTEHNIAFSNSIYQDSNIMIGYHQDPSMEKIKKVEIRVIKNRGSDKGPIGDSGYGQVYEHWDRDKMIFEEWTEAHEWRVKDQS